MNAQVAPGVWMSLGDTTIELRVPRLFAEEPIALTTDSFAVCISEEMEEEEHPAGVPPLGIVVLQKGRRPANLLLVLAQPRVFPPVRLRARFGAEGFVFHRGRHTPHDGYLFHAFDRDALVAELTRRGVERTTAPFAWTKARR